MQRRTFLRLMALSGAAAAEPTWSAVLGPTRVHAQTKLNPSTSIYGQWVTRNGVPAFEYRANQDGLSATEWDPILPIGVPKTRRNWLMVGNQAVRLQCSNDG